MISMWINFMPTFAQNVDNPTSCNNFLTTILLSNNVEIAQCYIACLLHATMIYVFNSVVGERRTLLLMKYKSNDTFFLQDVDMLQLKSYSFHTMASDLDLGNHPLLRCKSCEHQMLQPVDLQLTQERVTYVQPVHEEATKVFSFNISPKNSKSTLGTKEGWLTFGATGRGATSLCNATTFHLIKPTHQSIHIWN